MGSDGHTYGRSNGGTDGQTVGDLNEKTEPYELGRGDDLTTKAEPNGIGQTQGQKDRRTDVDLIKKAEP